MTINRGAYKKIPQVQIQDAIIDVIDIWLRFASAHSDTAAMGDLWSNQFTGKMLSRS